MADARALADRILSTVDPQVRAGLAADPFAALESIGFQMRLRPEPAIPEGCSVAASIDYGPPARITVVAAASNGRQHFSALHEFGHSAIRLDTGIHDLFFEEPDGGIQLEEDVCDAIAGTLLIPAEHVDAHFGGTGPTARTVLDLVAATPNASREACCVRAAERLEGPGHVMVLKDGVAIFTASHSTPFRIRRGTPQGTDGVAARAARLGTARGHSPVTYASGAASSPFFVDARYDEEQAVVVAVFMANRPPWEHGLALPPEPGARADASCTHCDVDFAAFGPPCPTCSDYFHRGEHGCGRCSCPAPAAAHRTCAECFQRRPASNFSQNPAICDDCLGI
jgi:hypothetical protein